MAGQDWEGEWDRRVRRISAVLFWLTAAAILAIVFWPSPPAESAQHGLVAFLRRAHQNGLADWISYALIEKLANVVMFVPLGLFGALALRRRPWLIVIAAAVGSGLVELYQQFLLPQRYGSLADVATNAVGALIGFVIAVPELRRRAGRRRRAARGTRSPADPPLLPAAVLIHGD